MARLAKILSELDILGIPDGVRMIIATYAHLTDEERTLMLLRLHGGEIRLSNDECRLGVRIHETPPSATARQVGQSGFIIISGTRGPYSRKNNQKTKLKIAVWKLDSYRFFLFVVFPLPIFLFAFKNTTKKSEKQKTKKGSSL